MSAGSGTIARRETGQSDPFLRPARGLGLVFTVAALIMYARWQARRLDLGLAVAGHDARLPGGSSLYPQIAIAAAVAAIVQDLGGSCLVVFWRPSRDLFGIFPSAGFRLVGIICTGLDVIVAPCPRPPLAGPTRTRCAICWRPPGRGERRGEAGVLQSVFGSHTASPCSEPASRAGRLAVAPDVDV